MLFELIFNIIYGLLNFFVNLIPGLDLLAFQAGFFNGLYEMLCIVEFFIPVSVLLAGMGSMLALELLLWNFWIINWTVHRLPFVG